MNRDTLFVMITFVIFSLVIAFIAVKQEYKHEHQAAVYRAVIDSMEDANRPITKVDSVDFSNCKTIIIKLR